MVVGSERTSALIVNAGQGEKRVWKRPHDPRIIFKGRADSNAEMRRVV